MDKLAISHSFLHSQLLLQLFLFLLLFLSLLSLLQSLSPSTLFVFFDGMTNRNGPFFLFSKLLFMLKISLLMFLKLCKIYLRNSLYYSYDWLRLLNRRLYALLFEHLLLF